MGDGLVLESGTHAQLLANEQGPYYRLVEAQKLRESAESKAARDEEEDAERDSATLPEKHEGEDYGELAKEEVPLGRVNTNRSLASEILAQRQKEKGEKDYSMLYLFRRMGMINRDQWPRYAIGTIGAISTYLPPFAFAFPANESLRQ